jgi:hypothetical protein
MPPQTRAQRQQLIDSYAAQLRLQTIPSFNFLSDSYSIHINNRPSLPSTATSYSPPSTPHLSFQSEDTSDPTRCQPCLEADSSAFSDSVDLHIVDMPDSMHCEMEQGIWDRSTEASRGKETQKMQQERHAMVGEDIMDPSATGHGMSVLSSLVTRSYDALRVRIPSLSEINRVIIITMLCFHFVLALTFSYLP